MLRRSLLKRLIKYNHKTGLIQTECDLSLQISGYMRIHIKGVSYRLVNVLWFMLKKEIPQHTQVVQINNSKLDFRLSNLVLDTSRLDNMQDKAEKAAKRKINRERKLQQLKEKKEMAERFKNRMLRGNFFDKP